MIKRIFDVFGAAVGLIALSPVFVIAAIGIKLDSRGPILFKQDRVGRNFRLFRIYKFRTMVVTAGGAELTVRGDPRITRFGSYLRKSKVDELPQLWNILIGDMTLVGPRPEVPRYVELFREDYEEILTMRPGITDLASLKYRDEATILARVKDPEDEYVTRILPEKIRLAKRYMKQSSLMFDAVLILKTLREVFNFGTTFPKGSIDGVN